MLFITIRIIRLLSTWHRRSTQCLWITVLTVIFVSILGITRHLQAARSLFLVLPALLCGNQHHGGQALSSFRLFIKLQAYLIMSGPGKLVFSTSPQCPHPWAPAQPSRRCAGCQARLLLSDYTCPTSPLLAACPSPSQAPALGGGE